MFANVASGMMMWGVHFLSKKIPEAEYGTLITLLAVTILIPTIPLQMVFAQQTAAALATGRGRQLAGMVKAAWLGTFVLWLVAAVALFFLRTNILSRWQITNPAALWATLLVALGALWLPMFCGVLQGQQKFLWLGWTAILNGVGRMGSAVLIVLAIGGYAAGIMTGAALGFAAAVGVAIWQTRGVWSSPSEPFDKRGLLGQVIPLMLGFGAYQFLFTADTMFVKTYFTSEETAFYGAAGTLSRALVWLVGPLTAVMFPKIVHSAARAEKTNLMVLTLVCTAALAGCGALGLWVTAPWLLKLVYKPSYVEVATQVLPWYAFGMVPLTLGNVLVSNLLARSQFGLVPWLVALAVGYGLALTRFNDSLVTVLKTFGVFNLLLLGVCAWFTWKHKKELENGKQPSVF
jgi:O-antigen/teichoic acid export membrane protein